MASFQEIRRKYHKNLCAELLASRRGSKVPNIADTSSKISVDISRRIVSKLGFNLAKKALSPQTIGQRFAEITEAFLGKSFTKLAHLRPGTWITSTSQAKIGIAAFDQYEHLAYLQEILAKNPELKAALGGDYLITPDIIIARKPESDKVINSAEKLVPRSKTIGSLTPLREGNVPNSPAILHASISCKWTIRSDRAQNTRTEALNLIRNRKGNTPHIVAVTFEPMPARIASIALGTGDLDCMYHVALYELCEAVNESGREDQAEQLRVMVDGRRLRDISDLPLDLAV